MTRIARTGALRLRIFRAFFLGDRTSLLVSMLLVGASLYACDGSSEPGASNDATGDGGAAGRAGTDASRLGRGSAGSAGSPGDGGNPSDGGDAGGESGQPALGDGGANGGAAGTGAQGADEPRAIAIATGNFHDCALLSDGSARCWGSNDVGQLGDGTFTGPDLCVNGSTSFACSTTPLPVAGLRDATALALGGDVSCALLSSGTVKCWGLNDYGELGNDSSTGPSLCIDGLTCATTPVSVSDLTTATAISASEEEHSCALLSDGTVQCWGLNDTGQNGQTGPSACGSNDYPCAKKPVTVPEVHDAVAVSTATFHTCALFSSGKVGCWGSNFSGQLGNGTTDDSLAPVEVSNLTDAIVIATGSDRSCAIVRGGSIECWGQNRSGELGNGVPGTTQCLPGVYSFACSTSPVAVSGISGATALALGANHICALLDDGSLWCWGDGTNSPAQVPGLGPVAAVAAAANHTCALLQSGSVWCWGDNIFGWLGDGTTTSSATPVQVKL